MSHGTPQTISRDFLKQLNGYGLTTARIYYRMPDYRNILQEYVWQEYDVSPKFPILFRFLAFWQRELEGPLHAVQIAHSKLIRPAELKIAKAEFSLN